MILVYLAVGIVFGMISVVYSVVEGHGFFLALGLYSVSGLVGMLGAIFLSYVWRVLVASRPEAGANPIGPRFESVRTGILALGNRPETPLQPSRKGAASHSSPGLQTIRGRTSRGSGRRVRVGTGSNAVGRRLAAVSKRNARRARLS